jgi:HEAT repeat protein
MADWLPIVAGSLALATLPLIAVVVLRRIRMTVQSRRRARLEREVAPLALALVDGEDPGEGKTEIHGRSEAEALAAVLERYAQVVDGEARERIVRFFEESGAVRAAEEQVRSRRAWRRARAAKALGDMGSKPATGSLLGLLDDPDLIVRTTAARSLGRLRSSEAVEPLVRALADETLPRAVVGLALHEIGTDAIPGLIGLLETDSENVRATAVELIGRLGCASEGAHLLACMDDPSAEVRARACRALGRLGSGEACRRLRQNLDARVPFLRAAAASGLGRMGDPEGLDALMENARTDVFPSAHAAARAAAAIAPARVRDAAQEPGAGPHLVEEADRIAWRLPL